MRDERVVIEVADDTKGLINLENARERALRLGKMTKAITLQEHATALQKMNQQNKEIQEALNANPIYNELWMLEIERQQLLVKAFSSMFSQKYIKQADALLDKARELAVKEFGLPTKSVYRSWVTNIEDIIDTIGSAQKIPWPVTQDERIIEVKIMSIKDWEKKTFDELYNLVANKQ